MKEEQAERKEEEQEGPEENGPVGEVDESSPAGEQTATEEAQPFEESEEEGELVEEVQEAEELVEGELIQRRGCLRGCLTPIAAILAIGLVVAIIGYAKRDAIREVLLKRIIANTQRHVLAQLPEDMDEKEIEVIFEEAKTALRENRIDEEALTEAMEQYHDTMRRRPSLEQKKQEIDKLMERLNSAIIVPME